MSRAFCRSKTCVKLLGTNIDSIKKAEDREAFKETMEAIGEPVIDSVIVNTVEEALDFAKGGGLSPHRPSGLYPGRHRGRHCRNNEHELIETCKMRPSRQPGYINASLKSAWQGYKEIEFEVMRDSQGQLYYHLLLWRTSTQWASIQGIAS